MSFRGKQHNTESRKKIADGVKRYYAERETKEMSEARKEKLREINMQKEDVYRFFMENLKTINKAIQRERRAKRNKTKPHGKDDDINKDI